MTNNEYKAIIAKLKGAKSAYFSISAPTLLEKEKLRSTVMARIDRSMTERSTPDVSYPKWQVITGILRYIMPPQFVFTMAGMVLIVGLGVAAAAAQYALPGQSLYSTKLAIENTGARFVSNPAQRAKVQMEIAGHRLEEVRQGTDSPEQETQVLQHFSQAVKEAKQTLKQAGDPLQVEVAQQELNKKAKEYEEKLLQTKITNKANREVGVAAYEEAEQALKDVAEGVKDVNKPPLTPP